MSRLKDLRSEWKRLGEEHRKTYRPSVGGTPLKIFSWWEKETGKIRRPVNLCHFFWTVVLWAPLLWLRKQLKKSLNTTAGLVTVGLIALAAFIMLCVAVRSVLWVTLFILGIAFVAAYVIGSFKLSYHFYCEILDGEEGPDWYLSISKRPATMDLLLALSAPAFILLGLFVGIVALSNTRAASKLWHWYAKRPRFNTMLTLRGYTGIALFVTIEILSMVYGLWELPGATLGTALVVGAAIAIGEIKDRVSEKRKPIRERKRLKAREARAWAIATTLEPALQILFAYYHPKKAGDRDEFVWWKIRYFERVNTLFGFAEWDNMLELERLSLSYYVRNSDVHRKIGRAIFDIKYSQLNQSAAPTQPNRVTAGMAKAGSTAKEFTSLIWQGFKSFKWQICPWIEVDET